jgi:replicative DNA helicase
VLTVLASCRRMTVAPARHRLQSIDAERSVLGALLTDPDRYYEIGPDLADADFADPVHAAVFAAIRRLHEERRSVDFITVAEVLKTDAAVQRAGGSAFLGELAAGVPTASHAAHYAAIIRDRSLHRQLADYAAGVERLASDADVPADDALERAEQLLLALARTGTTGTPTHIADIGAESFERYVRLYEAEDKVDLFGLRTGFRQLDLLLTGLAPGNLVIIAARPGMGKSSLALDIARNVAALQHKNVAVFSLEMTRQEIMDRTIAGLLGIEAWKLKKGELTAEDFARMGTLFDGLRQHPLYIDDDPDTSIAHLRSKARRQQMEHGLDLLVVDYLQLIEVTDRVAGENRTQQVSYISRALKILARELQCPVIALSQLSRAVEQRSPPIPILADLRDSGTIEQDADAVLMLYREDAYNEDCAEPGMTDLYVRKNRNGPTGRVGLFFDKQKMSFRDPAQHTGTGTGAHRRDGFRAEPAAGGARPVAGSGSGESPL